MDVDSKMARIRYHLRAIFKSPESNLEKLEALLEYRTRALERIAVPPRPDGTYNLSREACQQIAQDALEHQN